MKASRRKTRGPGGYPRWSPGLRLGACMGGEARALSGAGRAAGTSLAIRIPGALLPAVG